MSCNRAVLFRAWVSASLIIAMCLLGGAVIASAASLQWVHSFAAAASDGTYPEGYAPTAGLTLGSDGNFYGVAYKTLFSVTPTGTFTVLYHFANDLYIPGTAPLARGKDESGKLTFYGFYNHVVKISTDGTPAGTTVSSLYDLDIATEGAGDGNGGLIAAGQDGTGKSVFFGAAGGGGAYSKGTILRVVTDGTVAGTTVKVLHTFGTGDDTSHDDGAYPDAPLLLASDGYLYGTVADDSTAYYGDHGRIFRLDPATGALHVVYIIPNTIPYNYPSGLVEPIPGVFFGTMTWNASSDHRGSQIFKFTVSPSVSFTTVYQFPFGSDVPPSRPLLVDADGEMYGALQYGGANGRGGLFAITPSGVFQNLYDFSAVAPTTFVNNDGAFPSCTLAIDAAGNLYGTAGAGGQYHNGTVYRLNAPPKPPLPPFTAFDVTPPANSGGPVHCTATIAPGQTGITVRVQFSTLANPSATDDSAWTDLLDGGVMTEQPAGSGNYVLDSAAYPTGNVFFRAVARKPGSTHSASDRKGPFALHANPKLSATGFTVNGSTSPSNNVTDSALRFAVRQTGRVNGLVVNVQACSTACDANATATDPAWSYLSDNNNGKMGYDPSISRFILNSTSYPLAPAVYFRAVSTGAGVDPSVSNVVGPFNLSTTHAHITPPVLYFTANGHIADLYFSAVYPAAQSGVIVRVQMSTTPSDESSWTALDNGHLGTMLQSKDPAKYIAFVNKLQDFKGLYFRSYASTTDDTAAAGRSLPMGPFDLTQDIPPTVQMTKPAAKSGSGTIADPLIVEAGSLINIVANAVSPIQRQVAHLAAQIDGTNIAHVAGAALNANVALSIGDHVLQPLAVDDLGAFARAAEALHIRAIPPASGVKAAYADGATTAVAASAGHTYYVDTPAGFWDDPKTWRDEHGTNGVGVPGLNDIASIGGITVTLRGDVDVGAVTLNGGAIYGSGRLSVHRQLTVTDPLLLKGPLVLDVLAGAVGELQNDLPILFQDGATLENHGMLSIHGAKGFEGVPAFVNNGTIKFNPPLHIAANADTDPAAPIRLLASDAAHLTGGKIQSSEIALIGQDGSSLISQDGGGLLSPNGSNIVSQGAGNVVAPGGGSIVSQGAGNIASPGAANIVSQGAGNLVSPDGGSIVSQGAGNIVSQGAGNFHQSSTVKADTAPQGITQSGGEVDLNGVTLVGSVTMNGGILSGSGLVVGDLTNNGGYITPGHSAGVVGVTGNFSQGPNGTIVIENGGWFPSQFDRLQIGGKANLGGRLDVKTINGYQPATTDTFSPLSFASATGGFASVSSDAQVTINGTGLVTSIDITKPQPTTGQPLNISTRMEVLSGDNVLIAGFIVSGDPGSTKTVMIRGLGPSLASAGITNPLADPLLELHEPGGVVVVNDNWQQGDTSAIPTGFAPADPRESVIVAKLTVGSGGYSNFTAILRGAHGETGIGLAEAYDLTSSTPSKLANISTRGFVDTGDNVMIGGFIVGGTEPAKMLMRGIGPSLASSNVAGALAATTLELHDANGGVIKNEGWRSTQEADIIATTIPPQSDKDSAILQTLAPGNYTAILRGANNTTGVGLVEAYKL